MKGFVATLLVVTLAFAGCAGKSGSTTTAAPKATTGTGGSTSSGSATAATSSASASGSGTSSTSSSTSEGPAASVQNKAPTASIVVRGQGGLQVNFTLSGSDVDGDQLTYAFDADGKAPAERTGAGTEFPVLANFTYPTAGLYNASFSVSDGKNATIAMVAVNVTALAAGATTQVVASSYLIDNPACAMQKYDALPSNASPVPPTPIPMFGSVGADTLSYVKAPVEPGTRGLAFTADFASGALEDHVLFLDPAGGSVGTVQAGAQEFLGDLWTASGTVPTTAAFVVFYGCFNTGGEAFTYTAGA